VCQSNILHHVLQICQVATVFKDLSVTSERSGIANLSSEKLEHVWSKAKKLLNAEGSVCAAPGMCDTMCVESETGSRPHFV